MTDVEKRYILKLYKDGDTIKNIASELLCSESTIRRVIRDSDTPIRVSSRPAVYTDSAKEKVVELYTEGLSILDIIEATQIRSEQTIYRILKEKDVTRRRNRG